MQVHHDLALAGGDGIDDFIRLAVILGLKRMGVLQIEIAGDDPAIGIALIGASANGRILWKLADGRCYADWEAEGTLPQGEPVANV